MRKNTKFYNNIKRELKKGLKNSLQILNYYVSLAYY